LHGKGEPTELVLFCPFGYLKPFLLGGNDEFVKDICEGMASIILVISERERASWAARSLVRWPFWVKPNLHL
jgi:hypothetical protein